MKFTREIFFNILKKHNSNVFEVVRGILHITSYKNLRSPLLCQNNPPPAKKTPLKNHLYRCFGKHSDKAFSENSNQILVVMVFARKTSKGQARYNLIKKGYRKVPANPPPSAPYYRPLIGIFFVEKTRKNMISHNKSQFYNMIYVLLHFLIKIQGVTFMIIITLEIDNLQNKEPNLDECCEFFSDGWVFSCLLACR